MRSNKSLRTSSQSLGIQAVNLVIESEDTAITRATELISQARQQIFNEFQLREFLQLIETILIYKLPNTNREELEAMFSLDDLKQTRYFQDVMAEGERNAKLAAAPRLLALGLTVEQVAGALDLDVEVVRQIAASEIQNDAPTAE